MKTDTNETVIDRLESHIQAECKAINPEHAFDEMLDENYSFESVGGIFACMSPSRVLRECDPTAHRCGVNDYANSQGWLEIDSDYYEARDVDEAHEVFCDELESEITDLEKELEETPPTFIHATARLNQALHSKRADLETARNHSF